MSDSPFTPSDDQLEAQLRKLAEAPLPDRGFSTAVLSRLPRRIEFPKVGAAPYVISALLTGSAGAALSVHFHDQILSTAAQVSDFVDLSAADVSPLSLLSLVAVGLALSASAYFLPRVLQSLK